MKKILIFSHAMEIGGAERALLGLLENINTNDYQVDLFLMRHEGELMKYIPSNINLLPEIPQYTCLAIPFKNVIRKGQFGMAVGRFVGKQKASRRVRKLGLKPDNDVALQYSHKSCLNFAPAIRDEEYDLAISFLTPHYFVAEKVKAKRKIAWIHTDYAYVDIDKEEQVDMWNRYDVIASISEQVTKSFLTVLPELKDKIWLMPNLLPVKYMNLLANAFPVKDEMPDDGSIKILSIGRYCHAKNFDNVPEICRLLRNNGINVKWYIIGFGSDEGLIKERIVDAGMSEYVTMLGKKENPYPYIAECDWYIQPSRYEGKCVSVLEAQVMHKPVIITKYSTSDSQLKNGFDGIVVPLENIACADQITEILKDSEIKHHLIKNTYKMDYFDVTTLSCIYKLMEEFV